MILHHPTVGLGLVRNLSRRIKFLTEKLGALSEPMLEDRLYQVLVRVAQDVGHPRPRGWVIEFPLSHEEIGFLVGAHRVSVTRAMARLREEGRIYLEGKLLFVQQASEPFEPQSYT
ncbi:MAG: Crp/Fnr family transcriptional regulator [Deltaproteobacteria bacterium]|nr:Crp/Fnr family transcriptional regulator [Deltaproteobacteria bacterium]